MKKVLNFYISQIFLDDGYVLTEVHKFKPFKKHLKAELIEELHRTETKITEIRIKKVNAFDCLKQGE